MKLVRKILFYLNVLLVIITLLAYLSPFINPSQFWALSLLGLAMPILLLLNILFAFYWLSTQWKKAWLSIAVLILGAQNIILILSFSGSGEQQAYDFSVASYNMNYAYGTIRKGSVRYDKTNSNSFKDFVIEEIDADVLCGQETNKYIRDLIGNAYPFRQILEDAGASIYSRFPIVGQGQIDFGTRTNSCVWADIKLKQDTIRIYSVHLQSNKISREADQIVEEVEKDQQVNMLNIRSMLSKYKRYVVSRASQVQMIRDHMKNSPYPVILGGDLNDPPVSYTHRMLAKDKQDAFVVAGRGMGVTYAGNIPLLRIDNILLSDDFEVGSFKTINEKFSDHYPVRCTVILK